MPYFCDAPSQYRPPPPPFLQAGFNEFLMRCEVGSEDPYSRHYTREGRRVSTPLPAPSFPLSLPPAGTAGLPASRSPSTRRQPAAPLPSSGSASCRCGAASGGGVPSWPLPPGPTVPLPWVPQGTSAVEKYIRMSISELDVSTWERCTPSYVQLPGNYPKLK